MNELDTYILPNIKLINPILKRFTINRRFASDELATWIKQSQNQKQGSTLFSYRHIFGHFLVYQLSFNHVSFNVEIFKTDKRDR